MSRTHTVALIAVLLALAAVPAMGGIFEVRLSNGNVFETRYEPEPAPWDDSLLFLMTITGNTMAVANSEVVEIVSSLESSGQGTYLDAQTILIGAAPNDNLTPEELAALGEQEPPPPLPYSVQQFAEPSQTQGIPVWFTNQTTPPLGAGGGFGGAASARRGGGGGVFAEPNTTNF